MTGRRFTLAGAALAAVCGGSAWADEVREAALENEVKALRQKVEELARRVNDGANRSDDELEARVAELEKLSKKDQDGLFAYWKTGMKLDSADGAFKLSVFGRLQNDWVFFDSDQEVTDTIGETGAGTEFRRARIGLGGTIYKNVVYKYEMDFAGGSAANWADAYMELKDPTCGALPAIANFRVGHFDEPMGLDRLTSSKYGTFMERGLQEAFVPARNTGMMIYGPIPGLAENRINWYFGYFRDANGNGDDLPSNTGDAPATPSGSAPGRATQEGTDNDNRGEHNLTMRVAGRPWMSEDGTQWLHFGASASFRNPSDEKVQYRSRAEIHQGPQFVDTGVLTGIDKAQLFGLEGAGVFGPFSFAAEWVESRLEGGDFQNVGTLFAPVDNEDREFNAKSVQVSYFLTGETREYDQPMARWDRVKVRKNFGSDGWGAWELALRYSTLNLNDGSVDGHSLKDWTFGVNWYLNPNTRVMLNVIHAERQDLPSINAVGVRFMVDF